MTGVFKKYSETETQIGECLKTEMDVMSQIKKWLNRKHWKVKEARKNFH